MNRPSVYPEWANNDLNDPVTGFPNKDAPEQEFKDSGLLSGEDYSRQYINYQFDLLNDWTVNADERTSSVGKVYLTTASLTAQNMQDVFGGTWINRGAEVLAGISINVWERTA